MKVLLQNCWWCIQASNPWELPLLLLLPSSKLHHYQFLALLATATKKVDVSFKKGGWGPFLSAARDTMPTALSSFTPPASCKSYEGVKSLILGFSYLSPTKYLSSNAYAIPQNILLKWSYGSLTKSQQEIAQCSPVKLSLSNLSCRLINLNIQQAYEHDTA